jgi:hypothetical protein
MDKSKYRVTKYEIYFFWEISSFEARVGNMKNIVLPMMVK